jgi:hypothetical protein
MSVTRLIELAQNPSKLKELCKAEFGDICPKNIYREGNRIVIEYENETIAIPIRRRLSYEQWIEKRDRRLLKVFRKLRQLKQEYQRQREYVKSLRQQYYRLKQEFKELKKQYEALKLPTLEQLLSNKEMELIRFRGKYRTEQAKLKVIKSQIRSIKQRFERSRRIAKAMFESYKPMHSLPVSNWKKRIKEVLSLIDLYFEKNDINGLIVTKKLNHKDIETITSWHEWLNDLIYDLMYDLLIEYFNYGKEFKKPILVKMLQSELYSFSFDSAMKSVSLWLKTKP